MQVSNRLAIVVVVVSIAVGAVIGSKWDKPEVQIETVIKDRVVTIERQINRPDGTIERQIERVEDRQQSVVVAQPAKKDWTVQALYGINEVPYYGVGIYRGVLGDLSAGVTLNTRGEILVGLQYSF